MEFDIRLTVGTLVLLWNLGNSTVSICVNICVGMVFFNCVLICFCNCTILVRCVNRLSGILELCQVSNYCHRVNGFWDFD